jgi:hypothetical protein
MEQLLIVLRLIVYYHIFLVLLLRDVTNPTVYNRSIYKYNLIDVYKYNHMLL